MKAMLDRSHLRLQQNCLPKTQTLKTTCQRSSLMQRGHPVPSSGAKLQVSKPTRLPLNSTQICSSRFQWISSHHRIGLSESSKPWFIIIPRMVILCPSRWFCLPFYPSAFAHKLVGFTSLILHDMTTMGLKIGYSPKEKHVYHCLSFSSPMRSSILMDFVAVTLSPGFHQGPRWIPPQRYRWCQRTVPVHRRLPPRFTVEAVPIWCYDVRLKCRVLSD